MDTKSVRPGFELKDLPNALLGIFGIRTETELPFDLVQRDGRIELRKVPMHVELESARIGSRNRATTKSFDELLAFIKGANVAGKKYTMTVPVYEQKAGDRWRTSFYIKDDATQIPSPLDPNLKVTLVQESFVAVYKFSGRTNQTEIRANTDKLEAWIARYRAVAVAPPRLAQFDPPFAIPSLRRNEIQVPVTLASK